MITINIPKYSIPSKITPSYKQPAFKNFKENKINNISPKDNAIEIYKIFDRLEGKEGKDFANSAYFELVNYLHLSQVAPKNINWIKKSNYNNKDMKIVGDYTFFNNSVIFYEDEFLKQSKQEQVGAIAHELTHCYQMTNMIRTQEISLKMIANAIATADFNYNMHINNELIQEAQVAKLEGNFEEFKQKTILKATESTLKELEEAYKDIDKLPKHTIYSKNGQKALRDLNAYKNYDDSNYKNYSKSPIEKEANNIEKKFKNLYINYMINKSTKDNSLFNKIKDILN